MFVSIVIPVYNVAPFLGRCLGSCLRQTIKDIEVICVDDGSTDNGASLLDQYARIDRRIKVIHKSNEGVVIARKIGVRESSGSWILFLDGDDWLAECAVEILQAEIADDVDVITADHILAIDGRERVRRVGFSKPKLSGVDYVNECMRMHHGYIWGKLYRKSLVKSIDIDARYTQNEDYLINVMAGLKARQVRYVSVPVYYYYWDTRADRSVKYIQERGLFSNVNVHRDVVNLLMNDLKSRFVLKDGYLTYLMHNVGTGIRSQQYYDGFSYFKSEFRRAFLRTPIRLLAAILKRLDDIPAYLAFFISIKFARSVHKLYSPCFNAMVKIKHKMKGYRR